MHQWISISQPHQKLTTEDKHLCVTSSVTSQQAKIPLDDIEGVMVDSFGISYTQAALVELATRNIPLLLCDQHHLPVATLLATQGHHLQTKFMEAQLKATKGLKQRLWRSVVKHKIQHQASLLSYHNKPNGALLELTKTLHGQDDSNNEAQAAKFYYRALWGDNFRRNTSAQGLNTMLNYAYTILRGYTLKSLIMSGLNPNLPLFHTNLSNSYRLADDLMEPFRTYADAWLFHLYNDKNLDSLTPEVKLSLVSILDHQVAPETSLRSAIQLYTTSLAKVLTKASPSLNLLTPKATHWKLFYDYLDPH